MNIFIDACCGSSGGGYDYTLNILTKTRLINHSVIFAEDKNIIDLIKRKVQDESLNVIIKRRHRIFDYMVTEDLWRILIVPILVGFYRPKFFLSISGVVSPLLFNVRKISMIHNILPFQFRYDKGWSLMDRFIFLYRKILLTISMNCSHRVITFSNDSRLQLCAFVKKEKLFYVYHSSKFLAKKFFRKGDDKAIAGQINIFVNSSCMPHKNLKNMLKGISLLSGIVGEKISVRVAGSLGHYRYVQSVTDWWTSLNLTGAVDLEFLGYLDEPMLEKCCRESDVCIAPSVVEIFDIGCLDSLILCGRVCVSDINVHRELFSNLGGISFFDPFDPITLSYALRDCIKLPPCTHLEICNRFSDWNETAEANWALIYGDN